MEQTIHPGTLKTLRRKHDWTQKQLADKCKINPETISRWERGQIGRVREPLLKKLAAAFNVEPEELAHAPRKKLEDSGAVSGRVQVNVRVELAYSNALHLVCRRYNLRAADVVKLAPLLLLVIAEKSLIHRQANLDAIGERLDRAVAENSAAAPHLSSDFIAHDYYAETALVSEGESIKKRDVFGDHVKLEHADYDTFAGLNPFLDYLRVLMADIPSDLVNAYCFERSRGIEYTIAEETLREIIGISGENRNEIGIIDAIQQGEIDLRTALSRKESLSREDYVNWLQNAVDMAQGLEMAIRREAFTIAEDLVKGALREDDRDPAEVDPDEIERRAAGAMEDHPEILKEANRRVEARQKVTLRLLSAYLDESADDGEDS